MRKGRGATLAHGYKRNGTTTLFAAMNVLDGMVTGRNMQRHRHREFIRELCGKVGDGVGKGRRRIGVGESRPTIQLRLIRHIRRQITTAGDISDPLTEVLRNGARALLDLPRKSGEFLMKDEELHVEAETFYQRV